MKYFVSSVTNPTIKSNFNKTIKMWVSSVNFYTTCWQTAKSHSYYYYCPGGPVPEETFTHSHLKSSVAGGLSSFWILRGMWKITEASAPTIRLDATAPGPSMPPPATT